MKTFIFCTAYINNDNPSHRKERYERWLKYFQNRMLNLGADYLFLIDDGSPDIRLDGDFGVLDPFNLPTNLSKPVNLVHFKTNLGRASIKNYKGWWRSFTYANILAKTYEFDKIVHIESDFFITSHNLMDYISSVNSGWTCLFSNFHNFPESAVQIICKDQFPAFSLVCQNLMRSDFVVNESAEFYLPFTHIEKKFKGDRFGQLDVFAGSISNSHQSVALDYVGQILPSFKPDDFEPFFTFENSW